MVTRCAEVTGAPTGGPCSGSVRGWHVDIWVGQPRPGMRIRPQRRQSEKRGHLASDGPTELAPWAAHRLGSQGRKPPPKPLLRSRANPQQRAASLGLHGRASGTCWAPGASLAPPGRADELRVHSGHATPGPRRRQRQLVRPAAALTGHSRLLPREAARPGPWHPGLSAPPFLPAALTLKAKQGAPTWPSQISLSQQLSRAVSTGKGRGRPGEQGLGTAAPRKAPNPDPPSRRCRAASGLATLQSPEEASQTLPGEKHTGPAAQTHRARRLAGGLPFSAPEVRPGMRV